MNDQISCYVLFLSILFQFICMFMFMGLFGAVFPEVFDVLLVSSLLVRGSGMLHGLIDFTVKLNVNDKQRGALSKL